MGFVKRFVNMENIKLVYKNSGIDGVKRYLDEADSLIFNQDCMDIIKFYNYGQYDKIEQYLKLEELKKKLT